MLASSGSGGGIHIPCMIDEAVVGNYFPAPRPQPPAPRISALVEVAQVTADLSLSPKDTRSIWER